MAEKERPPAVVTRVFHARAGARPHAIGLPSGYIGFKCWGGPAGLGTRTGDRRTGRDIKPNMASVTRALGTLQLKKCRPYVSHHRVRKQSFCLHQRQEPTTGPHAVEHSTSTIRRCGCPCARNHHESRSRRFMSNTQRGALGPVKRKPLWKAHCEIARCSYTHKSCRILGFKCFDVLSERCFVCRASRNEFSSTPFSLVYVRVPLGPLGSIELRPRSSTAFREPGPGTVGTLRPANRFRRQCADITFSYLRRGGPFMLMKVALPAFSVLSADLLAHNSLLESGRSTRNAAHNKVQRAVPRRRSGTMAVSRTSDAPRASLKQKDARNKRTTHCCAATWKAAPAALSENVCLTRPLTRKDTTWDRIDHTRHAHVKLSAKDALVQK